MKPFGAALILFGAMLSATPGLRAAEPSSINQPAAPAPAAAKPIDYKAMPSIVGVHLGMPTDEATATLRATYKNAVGSSQGADTYRGYPKPVMMMYGVNLNTNATVPEHIYVYVTPPPQPISVWRIKRYVYDPNRQIARAQLLASLRQKYGKETVALLGASIVQSDAEATTLWWLYDEQGRPAALPGGGVNEVRQCLNEGESPAGMGSAVVRPSSERAPEHNYCTTSLVIVTALVGQSDPVTTYTVDAYDLPLASRASDAALAMMHDADRRQQQQVIEKARENKPNL